jgi:hypothetical protein
VHPGRATGPADDRVLAAYLTAAALLEIRALAGRARHDGADPDEVLARIRFLADLCDGMPLGPQSRPSRGRRASERERALRERPMSHVWQVSGPEKREWMLREIDRIGYAWTPPPPLPVTPRGPAGLSLRQRAGLTRWPVTVPREARVLKAVDGEALLALHGVTGEGDAHVRWLRAHVDLPSPHFLLPDPAPGLAPAGDGQWWCRALVRMVDGEQVAERLLVRADDFRDLPATVPRLRQRRLAHAVRGTGRDVYLWRRDHDAAGCGCC